MAPETFIPPHVTIPGFPTSVIMRVHWGENDALGHANNVQYFRWFESARIEAMRALGGSFNPGSPQGPILAETACTYLKPVVAPTWIVAAARLVEVGRTSYRMEQVVALAEAPEVPVARGYAVVVWVDYASGKAVPLPEVFRAAADQVPGLPVGD